MFMKKARPGGGHLVGLTQSGKRGIVAFYRMRVSLPRFRKVFSLRLADFKKAYIMGGGEFGGVRLWR